MKTRSLLSVFVLVSLFLGITLHTAVSATTNFAPDTPAGGTIITSTVTLTPIKDNTLYENVSGDLSNGAGVHFYVGRTNMGALRRGVLAFDLANGGIPPDASIISATLTLNLSRFSNFPAEEEVTLHRALSDWGEGNSNGSGSGAPAASGDATWLHTFYDTDFWLNPGGDYTSTASAVTLVTANTLGSYSWGSTMTMTNDIQDWLTQPATNFGWLLIGDETQSGSAKQFDTKENVIESNRPTLTISYVVERRLIYLPTVLHE